MGRIKVNRHISTLREKTSIRFEDRTDARLVPVLRYDNILHECTAIVQYSDRQSYGVI
jgi:hypothetical protein